jgi:LacI family transcriptional regulator
MSAARPTIVDVAARAGVSTATVSRVLSGSQVASVEARERVLTAAEALDYRPSAVARALKLQSTRTIGLVVTDIENPFFPQLVGAIESEATARGYGLLLCNTTDDAERELAALHLLVDRRVDGIIVASSRAMRRHGARLRNIGVPVVLVNSGGVNGLAGIETAQRRGGRLAADHLLGLGHRQIAHVTAPRSNAAAAARLSGVRDAVRAVAGAHLEILAGDSRVDGGVQAVADLPPGVTAIVCYNDLTAIGVMRGLRSSGRHVPDDVSVIGFDDIDMARWTDPPLTTVRQPTDLMGRLAVERVAGGLGVEESLELEPELVIRGSTAPPPRRRFAGEQLTAIEVADSGRPLLRGQRARPIR